jgi:hypothetical protein
MAAGSDLPRASRSWGARLDKGYNILIYPEGKLTVGRLLQPFKAGAGLVAVEGATAIIPMKLKIHRMSIIDRRRFPAALRGDIELVIGEPMWFDADYRPRDRHDPTRGSGRGALNRRPRTVFGMAAKGYAVTPDARGGRSMNMRESLVRAMHLPADSETVQRIHESGLAIADQETMSRAIHDVYCGIMADHYEPNEKDRAQAAAMIEALRKHAKEPATS